MLRSIHLKDFKSFADEKIELSPFTLLIGANAAGKSNLFDALRLLQGLALDFSLTDVLRGRWEGGREIWQGIRGGSAEITRGSSKEAGLTTTWEIADPENEHLIGYLFRARELTHGIRFAVDPLGIVEGSLKEKKNVYFDTHARTLGGKKGRAEGGAIDVALKRAGSGKMITTVYSAGRGLLRQIAAVPGLHPDVIRVSQLMATAMANVSFLDITPSKMRSYDPIQTDRLEAEGENISAVLYQLCQDPEQKADLVDWLTELCAPELVDIEFVFVETDLGDVMLRFVEQDGTRISARSLSDGTLRFLGELGALKTAPRG